MRFVPEDLRDLYEFHEWRNAIAVLSAAYPEEWGDLLHVLRNFRLFRSDIEKSTDPDAEKFGDRSKVVLRMDDYGFQARGWKPREFATSIVVDGLAKESPTHEVDCFKGKVALEVEWNARTEFYDRDLNNFRRLFELEAVDVGVIVTPLRRTPDHIQISGTRNELRCLDNHSFKAATSLGRWRRRGLSRSGDRDQAVPLCRRHSHARVERRLPHHHST